MLKDDVFFEIVMQALKERTAFSTVRMSDGEKIILEWARNPNVHPQTPIDNERFNAGWHERFGTAGITAHVIKSRLEEAWANCDYFCPGAGVHHLFPPHKNPMADKQHTYEWTRAQRRALLTEAGKVCLINRDEKVLDEFAKNRGNPPEYEVSLLKLTRWTQTEGWRKSNEMLRVPLVLLSGGPAAKYLAPKIAREDNCMVLDIGQGADAWFMATGIEAV